MIGKENGKGAGDGYGDQSGEEEENVKQRRGRSEGGQQGEQCTGDDPRAQPDDAQHLGQDALEVVQGDGPGEGSLTVQAKGHQTEKDERHTGQQLDDAQAEEQSRCVAAAVVVLMAERMITIRLLMILLLLLLLLVVVNAQARPGGQFGLLRNAAAAVAVVVRLLCGDHGGAAGCRRMHLWFPFHISPAAATADDVQHWWYMQTLVGSFFLLLSCTSNESRKGWAGKTSCLQVDQDLINELPCLLLQLLLLLK